MNIIFTLSRKVVADSAEVYIRFYASRSVDLRARTRVFVPLSAWNSEEGRCVISRRYETPTNARARNAQAQLDEIAELVKSAYTTSGARVDRKWLQNVIDRTSEEKPITDIVDTYCDTKELAPRTRYKLHSLRLHLLRYEKARRTRIHAHSITREQLDDICKYLRKEGALGQNALASRMRQLRALVYFGGRPYPNPFDGYTLPQEVYADPVFLTREERDRIATFDGLTNAKAVQRDIFIFQCYVGCRVSDLFSLSYANIHDRWLIYSPSKTSRFANVVEVPLCDHALRLIERYKGVDPRGRLFPFISDAKYNKAIRAILQECGINRPVIVRDSKSGALRPVPLCEVGSSHLARKTFSQIAYATTNDKRLVASMTGHSENSRAFNRYTGITREMKERALELFADKLPT